MQRREFLQSLGGATLLGGLSRLPAPASEPDALGESAELRALWVKKIDEKIAQIFRTQLVDAAAADFGGFADRHGIYHVSAPAWNACHLAAGFLSPESAYFQSSQVEERLIWAIEFVRRRQHDDGTVDLLTTNFHSPPDTAFVVEPIALCLSCIGRHAPEALLPFQDVAKEFLENASRALIDGGIHTPNHRWVVCMALARIHRLLGEDDPLRKSIERVDQWLAEGIDIDADGQYAERSTSAYTPLVNRCLMTVARILERPQLYDPVRKNLEMTRFLVRPTGELVTEISRRQDKYVVSMADDYYYPYRTMAVLDQNADYAAMAHWIERTVGKKNLYKQLFYGLEDRHAMASLPAPAPLQDEYEKFFVDSQAVRIRRSDVDATLLGDNPTFFVFQKGDAVLQAVRLATAFFGKGQFVSGRIERRNDGYVLVQQLTAPYAQPLAPELRRDDGDWSQMANTRRPRSNVQQLDVTSTIREIDGNFEIHFTIEGTDRVPWALELAFRHGGTLAGVTPVDDIDDAFLAHDGRLRNDGGGVTYRLDEDEIRISSGPVVHRWTQIRGALPKLDAQCVYFTGFTPADFKITIG